MAKPAEEVTIRDARPGDMPRLQAIRAAAFAPVFAGFRAALGPELAPVALGGAEAEQAALLDAMADPASGWRLLLAAQADEVAGFTAITLQSAGAAAQGRVGEVGLTAVDPDRQGQGVGRALLCAALQRLRAEGAQVATVGTGGDAAHAPARRLYARAGFAAGIPSVQLYRRL